MIGTLKLLIDTFFIILCLGILGFIFILPFGIFTTKIADVEFQGTEGYWNLPVLYWVGIGLSILAYIIFLIGLNHLRRTANLFMSKSFFSLEITRNLKRSGLFFVISGIIVSIVFIVLWAIENSDGETRIVLGTDIMIPLFLCIVGFFFMLQSKILDQAKVFKEDSNLTI